MEQVRATRWWRPVARDRTAGRKKQEEVDREGKGNQSQKVNKSGRNGGYEWKGIRRGLKTRRRGKEANDREREQDEVMNGRGLANKNPTKKSKLLCSHFGCALNEKKKSDRKL
jgi:hypothetical protein